MLAKFSISSMLRSLFSGRLVVFRNHEVPLFKVGRTQIEEVYVPRLPSEDSDDAVRRTARDFLFKAWKHVTPEPRQWVIVADAATIALRNIDHLLPPDGTGPHAPPETDFYWTPVSKGQENSGDGGISASPGFWAVRGEHLPLVLQRWEAIWKTPDHHQSEESAWTQLVRDLPLRKRRFEKREVIAPRIGEMDWISISGAAVVTVPDWPVAEQRNFLQALYFGTFLGDETGMILHVIEA